MSCLCVALALFALTGVILADPSIVPITGPLLVPSQQLLPKPYEFGFEFGDGLGMHQHRREVADGNGIVSGSYGYTDPLGVNRFVEYTADADGYRAVVKSNEPGAASQNTANAVFLVQPPPPAAVAEGLRSRFQRISI